MTSLVPARHRFGIKGRVPATTLRDALSTVDPTELRPVLHSTIRSAMRSKSITVEFDLPFSIVSMDGYIGRFWFGSPNPGSSRYSPPRSEADADGTVKRCELVATRARLHERAIPAAARVASLRRERYCHGRPWLG
jgi:hypothetical protein